MVRVATITGIRSGPLNTLGELILGEVKAGVRCKYTNHNLKCVTEHGYALYSLANLIGISDFWIKKSPLDESEDFCSDWCACFPEARLCDEQNQDPLGLTLTVLMNLAQVRQ